MSRQDKIHKAGQFRRPRVLLADDHVLLLEAFKKFLETEFEIVGTVEDGRELLKAIPVLRPDVIVTDIAMPKLNGLEALRKLRKRYSDIKVIFLTAKDDPDLVAKSIQAGVNGYLLKSSAAAELFSAIRSVLKGETYVTPAVTAGMVGSLANSAHGSSAIDKLSIRQREVLQLLAEGHTMKDTARILSITPRTVAFHKYRMMEDLQIETNAELIQFAVHNGLVST